MTPGGIIVAIERLGGRLRVVGSKLKVTAPKPLPPDLMASLREHKAEVMAELRKRRGGADLAVLMELPDGRRFWLAPDGMTFDAGGIPILRRSVMDALVAAGKATKTEIMRLIDAVHELGGELRMEPEAGDAKALPQAEKPRSGEMVKPDSKGGAA